MHGEDVHVFLRRGKWAVKRLGYRTPLSVHDERKDAVAAARAVAGKDGSHVVIFDVGGKPLPFDAPDITP